MAIESVKNITYNSNSFIGVTGQPSNNTSAGSISVNQINSNEVETLDLNAQNKSESPNILETTGATLVTGATMVLNGLANIGEELADFETLIGGAILSVPTTFYDLATGNNTTGANWEKIMDFVTTEHVNDAVKNLYATNDVLKAINDKSALKVGSDVYNVGTMVSQILGEIGLTIITAGGFGGIKMAMTGATTGAKVLSKVGAKQIGKTMARQGAALSFATETSKESGIAYKEGATVPQSLLYGVLSGAWEGAQWLIGGKVAGLGLKTIGADILQGAVDTPIRSALQGIYSNENFNQRFNENGGFSSMVFNMALAGVLSGIGEVPQIREFLGNTRKTKSSNFSLLQEDEVLTTSDLLSDDFKYNEFIQTGTTIEIKNTTLKEEINEAIDTPIYFDILLNKVLKTTDEEMIFHPGYKSASEYKKAFAKLLKANDKFASNIDYSTFFKIARDEDMFEELIDAKPFVEYLSKYIKGYNEKLFVSNSQVFKNLSKMDRKKITNFLNESQAKEAINTLKADDLLNFLSSISTKKNFNWLENDYYVNKVINLYKSEQTNIEVDFEYRDIAELVNASQKSKENYAKVLDAILDNVDTQDAMLYMGRYHRAMYMFPGYSGNPKEFTKVTNRLHEKRKMLDKVVENNFRSSFDNVRVKDGNIYILTNEQGKGVYDIKAPFETFSVATGDNGVVKLPYNIFDWADRYDGFKIESITKNRTKTNLYIAEGRGIEKGLNEITFRVDGKTYRILHNAKDNLSLDLSKKFPDAKEAQILSVKPKGSNDTVVPDINKNYKVTYEINGKEYSTYLHPSKDGILDIDSYLADNSLFDATNITFKEATTTDIKSAINMEESPILLKDKYGGDQSDVSRLIGKYLSKGNETVKVSPKAIMNNQKGRILNNIIDKYYPDLSLIDKVNLSKLYANNGCGYMAIANSFADYMSKQKDGEKIFKELFGYDLYVTNGSKKVYNTEAIAFDMFLERTSREYKGLKIKDLPTSGELGTSAEINKRIVDNYFAKHGINVEYTDTRLDVTKDINSQAQNIILGSSDSYKVLSADEFALKDIYGEPSILDKKDFALKKVVSNGRITSNIGGHAMLITDIKKNGNVVVSSWGNKFEFLPEYQTPRSVHVSTFKFSIGGN